MTTLLPIERPEFSFFWTSPALDTGELATEDPLGFDYLAQQVGLLLLPTLTTRSTRAQAFAMVLYGLDLAERAVGLYGYPNTDDAKRELFERWERFWALATLEHYGKLLPRGSWDAMRGVRGAQRAWRPGTGPLPLDFPLISRQQELGNLGAYLVPLRRSGLVVDGGIRPTPAAFDLIENFWFEVDELHHRQRFEQYALAALDKTHASIERTHGTLALRRVGKRSRLTSLVSLPRTNQQSRLYAALFQKAGGHTRSVCNLVETAAKAGVTSSRDILNGAIADRFGHVDDPLRGLLVTAREFGDFMLELLGAFDRMYQALEVGGWIVERRKVVAAAFPPDRHEALRGAASRLLAAPAVSEIRRFPMHGSACLRLADELQSTDAPTSLDALITYHERVQRDRRRGIGWIGHEGGRLLLTVTSYVARPDDQRFPSFKLDAVRTLLMDTGRLPIEGNEPPPPAGG